MGCSHGSRALPYLAIVVTTMSLSGAVSAGEPETSPPPPPASFLIARQPKAIQDAWRTIEELVQENESLPTRLPDPFFARGDLWASVGNHEEAIEDYLRAAKLTAVGRPNLVEQSRALARLSDALERLSKRPQPDFPAEAAQAFWAGVEHFEHRRIKVADAYFKEATRLQPSDAVYRAYRAVGSLRLGNTLDAERQMAVAASILRRTEYYIPRETRDFHVRLERVQGADRRWINDFIRSPTSERFLAETEAARWLQLHPNPDR